ncbi:hypothetical protein V1460_12770 [Streptomyces sp. SCSIO 30461]|uniref:hypothetical protein n=1 Tax=Streptomyces sp. SCSIO 30461 TaxID=3118085 RepID=UPI0030D362A8
MRLICRGRLAAQFVRRLSDEYNHTRLHKHPVYGYVTPLETRAPATQDLAPGA